MQPSTPLTPEQDKRIRDLLASGLSDREVARQAGVTRRSVARRRVGKPVAIPAATQVAEPLTHEQIRKLLRRGGRTEVELADHLNCSPKMVRTAVAEMKLAGAMIAELHGRYEITDGIHLERGQGVVVGKSAYRRFGFVSDNHLCNKHSRLDVLKAAYDYYEREGITEVFNGGNWIDGEARFNKTELVTAPGMDRQIEYMLQEYPQRKGITTHYIAGDDHEGWYQQREGVEVGRYLQMRAEGIGRTDLRYLGYGEADVKLAYGTGSAVLRVVHPGGGSSYAISYTDQKRVESYQGGEKPQIELAGHYHKFNYGYPREVHAVQTGCTCDQTSTLR